MNYTGYNSSAGANLMGNAAGYTNSVGKKLAPDVIPKGYRQGQLSRFTPEQYDLFQQLFSNVSPGSYLSRLAGGDESLFGEIEAPAQREFQSQIGQLGSRFSGLGMGAQRGSGFQNALNTAASQFSQDLASRRQELQRQALSDLMGISQSLLGQQPYEKFLIQKQQKQSSPSGLGGLFGAGLGGLGGFLAGGPAGAIGGAQLGYGLGSAF